MKKLLLLSLLLFFSNMDRLTAQDYNDMSKKELRIEHNKKLKSIDSLSQELNNKINENGLLKIKVDSLNKQLLFKDSNFNKIRVDLKLAVENSNKIAESNDSMKNRIKELEIELSNSKKIVSDLQTVIQNSKADSIESTSDKNNKDICSFVNRAIKVMNDIIQGKSMYDFDDNYFNTYMGNKELSRLQKEAKLLEDESDKFFEKRDGRTESDVKSNIERMKSCPKYDVFIEYSNKINELTSFIENVMRIKM